MKNRIMLTLSVIFLTSSVHIFGCIVTFVNDLSTPVNIILADKTTVRLLAGEQTTFGQADQMAAFTFVKQVQGKTFKYKLTQTSCSENHEIDVYASTIGTGTIEHFNVSTNLNSKPSGCGCGHKARPSSDQ